MDKILVISTFKGVVASDKNVVSPRFTNVTGRPPPLDLNVVPELALKIKEVPVSPCFVLTAAFEKPSSLMPVKGFSFNNSKVLSMAFYDSSKPGRSRQSENWVMHSATEYAENIIAQTGLQKLPAATLAKVADELFQEFQSTGLNIPQPVLRKLIDGQYLKLQLSLVTSCLFYLAKTSELEVPPTCFTCAHSVLSSKDQNWRFHPLALLVLTPITMYVGPGPNFTIQFCH